MNRREMILHNAKLVRAQARGKTKAERHQMLNQLRFGVLSPAFLAIVNAGGLSAQMQQARLSKQKVFCQ